jgi:hypothetical protein
MSLNTAQKRYTRRMIVLMTAYVGILVAAEWAFNRIEPAGPAAYLLGILPALPVIAVFFSMGQYLVDEKDEYLRLVETRKSLIATGFMLTVTTAIGFLQSFDLVPHIDFYWAAILWFAGLGVGSCVQALWK